jgi:hypothetical protein
MPDLQQLLQGRMGPDVMAIGASVFNGVRSATITRALAEKSAPAQVAKQMGWRIATPDYPRPVLLDLEELIRRIIGGQQKLNLTEIKQQVRANADAWLAGMPQGWSTQTVFDNIAIAQAGIVDLVTVNAGALKVAIPGLVEQLRQGTAGLGGIATLYFSINGAFLLNPSGKPELDGLSSVDQVALRKPKCLLVSVGSNEGLFEGAFTGPYDDRVAAKIETIPAKMRTLAEALRDRIGDDAAVPLMVWTNLIKPSAIANLMPRPFSATLPPGQKYYKNYQCTLFNSGDTTGEQIAAFDQQILRINRQVQSDVTQILAMPRRTVKFADIYAMSEERDTKHGTDIGDVEYVESDGDRHHLGNYPFSLSSGFRIGLFGLDNMHPTDIGYALMANQIIKQLDPDPARLVSKKTMETIDTLLRDPPQIPIDMRLLLSLVGAFGLLGEGTV